MENNTKYSKLLDNLIATIKKENRHLEFKSNHQSPEKIGQYISALSNGACLDNTEYAYLIFGVDDVALQITGTTFEPSKIKKGNEYIEFYLRKYIRPKIDFSIIEFSYSNSHEHHRIVMFKIPAAIGEPTTFQGKAYIRVDSNTTDLAQYPQWIRRIYNSQRDWSAQIIENATINDLDKDAIEIAKEGYKERYPDFAEELTLWNDIVFLDRAGLTQEGRITRTAMLLLGRPDRAYKLDYVAEMVWKCFQDDEVYSEIFTIPYIKTTTDLLHKIRNYRFKIYPKDSLIPAEVWKYDTRSILEAIHNCIAHQDYVKDERIIVTEEKNILLFENAGSFFDGSFDVYVFGTKTPKKYRNSFLRKAMVNIKMIDAQGYGIHKMFVNQKDRFLPMPSYDRSTEENVVLCLPGTVIDENYSLLLMSNSQISLSETILLDYIQKHKALTDEQIALLRKKHLIEGRKPNIYISKTIAQKSAKKIEYSKHKGLDANRCQALLTTALDDHKKLTRREIDNLLMDILSDQLSNTQKKYKIGNLLSKLKKQGIITNHTKGNISEWSLVK